VMILGGHGPNRIGQGIEFDYCCATASFCPAGDGFATVMVNQQPETVSPTTHPADTPFYFEPLNPETCSMSSKRERTWKG